MGMSMIPHFSCHNMQKSSQTSKWSTRSDVECALLNHQFKTNPPQKRSSQQPYLCFHWSLSLCAEVWRLRAQRARFSWPFIRFQLWHVRYACRRELTPIRNLKHSSMRSIVIPARLLLLLLLGIHKGKVDSSIYRWFTRHYAIHSAWNPYWNSDF